ncbi:mitochondrial 54S ribosomal protein YmL35 [Elasticomyces elasticus]|nr:mitochondrial 54S ribosomal protein YmL35 [Elasticomyces elasticus]
MIAPKRLSRSLQSVTQCTNHERQNFLQSTRRTLSSTIHVNASVESASTTSSQPPPPPPASPARLEDASSLNPENVFTRREERKLVRTQKINPVSSRRRRAALQSTDSVPFEQLPYQCFQEARRILIADRAEKIKQIEAQRERIARLKENGNMNEIAKKQKLDSMNRHLAELKIWADINDPIVKKTFEDGKGDLNKPIYRFLADRKWRSYARKLLVQRITQMNVIPDILPHITDFPTASVDLSFGRHDVQPGAFVLSEISEKYCKLNVQVYEKGERMVTIVVVNPDVPNVEKDGFDYRCHFLAANIPVNPTSGSIPFSFLRSLGSEGGQDGQVETPQIILPYLPSYAQKGAPYQRMTVFVLQQLEGVTLDVADIATRAKRENFILRSFIDRHRLTPIGVNMWRTKWDESTAGVMERAGIEGSDVEFKRKKIEPLPYKKLDGERYR